MENIQSMMAGLASADEVIRRNTAEDLGYSKAEEAIEPLVTLLNDSSRAVSEAAADALIMLGTEAVARMVVPLFDNENTLLRNYALEILSQLGEPAVPTLLDALRNPDHDVRKFAVDALNRINSPQSVPQLLETLADDDVNVSATAAEILGRLGGEKVIPKLVEHLEDSPWMSNACLHALGEIGSSQAHNIILAQISILQDPISILGAIQALAKIGSTQSIVPLISMLREKPNIFAEEIIVALETIIEKHREQDVSADLKDILLEPLYQTAKEGTITTRIKAIELLGELHQAFAIPFLMQLFYDTDGDIRKAAFHAVKQLHPTNIGTAVAILHDPDAPTYAKANALHTLGCWQRHDGHSAILPFLNHEHLTLQRVAVDALFSPVSEEVIGQLRVRLTSPDSEIRSHTLDTIARLKLKPMLNDVLQALHDLDEDVRKSGNEAFIALTSDEDETKVHPFLNSLDQDERRVAFEYFSTHIDKSITPQLLQGLKDPNWEIRKFAIKVLVNTDPEHAAALIAECFQDEHPDVVVAAIHAYGSLKGESCRMMLEEWLQHVEHPRFIYEILTALGRIGSPQSIPAIQPYLNQDNTYWKLTAIDALKAISGEQAIAALRQLYRVEEDDEILKVLDAIFESLS